MHVCNSTLTYRQVTSIYRVPIDSLKKNNNKWCKHCLFNTIFPSSFFHIIQILFKKKKQEHKTGLTWTTEEVKFRYLCTTVGTGNRVARSTGDEGSIFSGCRTCSTGSCWQTSCFTGTGLWFDLKKKNAHVTLFFFNTSKQVADDETLVEPRSIDRSLSVVASVFTTAGLNTGTAVVEVLLQSFFHSVEFY